MAVNSKKVKGRRDLTFRSLDEVVSDAEQLVADGTTITIGNWPLENLLTHLTMTVNNSIDGFPVTAPWIVRLFGPLIKKSVLKAPKMNPGIRLPKSAEPIVFPDAISVRDACEGLRRAVARVRTERMEADHPAFGPMTHDEWLAVHLKHSELQLSYAIPGKAGVRV